MNKSNGYSAVDPSAESKRVILQEPDSLQRPSEPAKVEHQSPKRNLFAFSIFARVDGEQLARAASSNAVATFQDGRDWGVAHRLWEKAIAVDAVMPIVFVNATNSARLVYWGILESIDIESGSTQYSVKQLRKVTSRHFAKDLVLRDGGVIDPDRVDPDVTCLTPSFILGKSTTISPSAAQEWRKFAHELALCLADLVDGEFLIISAQKVNHYVQFSAQGTFGMRAEATCNGYIDSIVDTLSTDDYLLMAQLGWNFPTKSASAPHTPDGSPNFYVEFTNPVKFGYLADLAVQTLRRIYRIGHPGELQYRAFLDRLQIRFPSLRIKREG